MAASSLPASVCRNRASRREPPLHPLPQTNSVARRVPAGVVVEVDEHIKPFSRVFEQPPGPVIQPRIRVTTAVLFRAVMEPHIDKRTDDHPF